MSTDQPAAAPVEPLTEPQMACLRALADLERSQTRAVRPRDVAMALWPDSEGWDKRSSRGSNRVKQGALGATMPMKAAALLSRLQERGCAMSEDGDWMLSGRGQRVLAGTDQPLPKPVRRKVDLGERMPKPQRKPEGWRNQG